MRKEGIFSSMIILKSDQKNVRLYIRCTLLQLLFADLWKGASIDSLKLNGIHVGIIERPHTHAAFIHIRQHN